MELVLKYEPVPSNAGRFAQDIVVAAREISGIDLDYSIESLSGVDAIIEQMRADKVPVEAVAETLFGFGCYVGEVLIRVANGKWDVAVGEEKDLAHFPFVVRFADGSFTNPINRVFKRLEEGEEANISYYAQVAIRDARKASSRH